MQFVVQTAVAKSGKGSPLLCTPSGPHGGQGVRNSMRDLLLHSVFPRDTSRIQTAVGTSIYEQSCGRP